MAEKIEHLMILAGGTGGHIFPGLAVAHVLREQGKKVSWMGAHGGMEIHLVKDAGIDMEMISISRLRGAGIAGWLKLPYRMVIAIWQAWRILRRQRPDVVLAMGGFVSGPGALAARLMQIPLVVHEQNAIPGLTNKVLVLFARHVLCGFPGVFAGLPKAQHVGNPVRKDILNIEAPEARFEGRSGPIRLLIIGGSQGARIFNTVVPAALERLPKEKRPEIWHQTGPSDTETTQQRYQEIDVTAKVSAFIRDVAEAFSWCDLVLCRAGAMTIAEVSAAGVASILVPYPHAVDDHQTANSKYLSGNDAALVIPEPELTATRLAEYLEELSGHREVVLKMAVRAKSCGLPDAADTVASVCMEAIHA